jgi:carbamoyltransferase
MRHVHYGPGFDAEAVEAVLRHAGVRYTRPEHYPDAIAERLAAERVIGWFLVRM